MKEQATSNLESTRPRVKIGSMTRSFDQLPLRHGGAKWIGEAPTVGIKQSSRERKKRRQDQTAHWSKERPSRRGDLARRLDGETKGETAWRRPGWIWAPERRRYNLFKMDWDFERPLYIYSNLHHNVKSSWWSWLYFETISCHFKSVYLGNE